MKLQDVNSRFYISMLLLSLVFLFTSVQSFREDRVSDFNLRERQLEASDIMFKSLSVIKRERLSRGIGIGYTLDPNVTGIIGEEFTELTTTLGHIKDKRSSANPDFAAMMVKYFHDAGLKKGDVVCIGASGSFPALAVATLSAAEALELRPVVIYSIGASMYGANLPEFTFIQMLEELHAEGIMPFSIVAVSMGGKNDNAEGMFFPESKRTIKEIAINSGLCFIHEETVEESISKRLSVYKKESKGDPVRCFVNIGGAYANFGDSEASIVFPNGLVRGMPELPPGLGVGLIFHFAEKGIPVIHLLNVKKLCKINGIPYDPIPFPKPGLSGVFSRTKDLI